MLRRSWRRYLISDRRRLRSILNHRTRLSSRLNRELPCVQHCLRWNNTRTTGWHSRRLNRRRSRVITLTLVVGCRGRRRRCMIWRRGARQLALRSRRSTIGHCAHAQSSGDRQSRSGESKDHDFDIPWRNMVDEGENESILCVAKRCEAVQR